MENVLQTMEQELMQLKERHNFRSLPCFEHKGREAYLEGKTMLNLSSNDYLGIAVNEEIKDEFIKQIDTQECLFSSSSSRLLTGNYSVFDELESTLAKSFGTEAALTFNSGYHANTGILPALCDEQTLILADKLVHASLIDGIRLSSARCIRYRHNNYEQLETLLQHHAPEYRKVIIVTESLFSMDGDCADLLTLVRLKHTHPNVLLYVDEAHAVGVRGLHGLGLAEEMGCVADIDLLVGTFGKALASVGAYVVCRQVVRDYLINRMRTFIFTTALPPLCAAWTLFVWRKLSDFTFQRQHLQCLGEQLNRALHERGYDCPSQSHIVPIMVGDSGEAVHRAEDLQRQGFYCLAVRPPTVPEGTSRIRLSLTATVTQQELEQLIKLL